jgi:hypothetical protein
VAMYVLSINEVVKKAEDALTRIREFQRWQKATGASTFLLRLRHAHSGGPPHDRILEAIRLFGERVLPYV